jgi:RsiW-degrading membrane proteinase PrsW (M82 family)
MLNAFSQLNWLAVLAASLAHFLLGGLWFMVLFKQAYAAALDLSPAADEKPGLIFILGPLVCSTITVATTALLLRLLEITTLMDGLVLGAIVGVGFIGATTVNIAINPKFPSPLRYSLINLPFFVIGSLIASGILVSMG